MPNQRRLHQIAREILRRWPASKSLVFTLLAPVYRTALWPYRRKARAGLAQEPPELVTRTEAFNQAAEEYYARFPDKDFLLNKPFSESSAAALHLIDTGVLMQALRLQPGDTVLEIGAGSCWLSHFLNRYGCRTLAVDVSPTALAIGRELFRRDPATDWTLEPLFLPYDGHKLPIDSGSCDRAIINDAFHHVPNQAEVLQEIARVLKPDGVLGMSEPGLGHHDQSRMEAATGVLENELVLEDVAALARRSGFATVHVVVAGARSPFEIPADDLAAFCGGKQFASYWKDFSGALVRHHYLLFCKGLAVATTCRPRQLRARLAVVKPGPGVSVRVGEQPVVTIAVRNTGDTTWLARAEEGRGWTRVGVHLLSGADDSHALIDFDWHRVDLPADVRPGGTTELGVTLPALTARGRYTAVFDLVVENMAWFADQGSPTLEIPISVV